MAAALLAAPLLLSLGLDQSVAVGVGGEAIAWFQGTAWRHEVDVAWRFVPEGASVAFAGGLRLAPGAPVALPGEAFVRCELVGRAFAREPAIGVEVGAGGLTDAGARPDEPAGARALEDERTSPVYVAVYTRPVQWAIGRTLLSTGEVHIGSDVSGSVLRFGVNYGSVAIRW